MVLMKNLYLKVVLLLSIFLVQVVLGEKEAQLLITSDKNAGWRAFGVGVLDSTGNTDKEVFSIDIDWKLSTWGVGCMHVMKESVKGKKLKGIRVKVKTANGSQTKVFAAVSTIDDANLVFKKSKAFPVTDRWLLFTFPVSGMIKSKPDVTSRMFTDDDWDMIQIVKFLFTKADSGVMKDKIFIQSPELIFE
jgi:hypothetical protein